MMASATQPARLELDRLEQGTSATCVFDLHTQTCVAANHAALALYGYTRDEFFALAYGDTLHPAETRNTLGAIPRGAMPRHCGTQRHLRKSGEEFIADIVAQDVVYADRDCVLVLVIDRSDAARTQALLRQREALFSALVEHSPDVIARIDRELRHVYVNPAIVAATGLAPNEVMGKTNGQLGVPLEICMRWAAGARRVFATGRQHDIEITYSTAEGPRHYESRMAPEFGADGKVESVLAIARDVTDRRRIAVTAQRARGDKPSAGRGFEALADALPEAITCYDRELRHVYANAAVLNATGLAPSALLHRTHAEAGFAPEVGNLWDGCLRRVFETGKPENLEFVFDSPAGARTYDAHHIPLTENGGAVTAVLRVAYDITERKKAEDERLATITRQRDAFVREVHHRVKNNLQGVVGLLRQLANNDPRTSATLEKVISQLLAMAVVHGVTGRDLHEGVALSEMVTEIARSVERISGKDVKIAQAANAAGPSINTNEAVPIAIILNELVLNATKHGEAGSEGQVVSVDLRGEAKWATITVANAGTLPPGFDFAEGSGLGTGLELVRALLPGEGAALSISRDNHCVTAVLDLGAPLLVAPVETTEQASYDWDRRKRSYSDRRR